MGNYLFSTSLEWLHLMATVAWIGGMFTNFIIYLPVIGKSLDPPTIGKLMGGVMKRFRVMVYSSIGIFVLTGLIRAISFGRLEGLFQFQERWAIIFVLKQVVFVAMVILAIYAFEFLAPKVARMAASGPSPELGRIQKFQMSMAKTGLILGITLLALTAAL